MAVMVKLICQQVLDLAAERVLAGHSKCTTWNTCTQIT